MDCEKECYWNYNNTCVYEDELEYNDGNPNEGSLCPNCLRKDFEKHFYDTLENIIEIITHRTCAELEDIEKFILNQRSKK